MQKLLIVIATLCLLVGIGWTYWSTTPLFAFQEAGLAYVTHDVQKFKHYVNLDRLTQAAVEDTLSLALITPERELAKFQEALAQGTVRLASPVVSRMMVQKAELAIAHKSGSESTSAAAGGTARAAHIEKLVPSLKNWLLALSDVVHEKLNVAQIEALREVQGLAAACPNSLLAQLLVAPPQDRGAEMKKTLNQYGFSPGSFQGIEYTKGPGGREPNACDIGIKFFSPQIGRPLVLVLQLERNGPLQQWRIEKVVNLAQTIVELEPEFVAVARARTASQLQGLQAEKATKAADSLIDKIEARKRELAGEKRSTSAAPNSKMTLFLKKASHQVIDSQSKDK